MTSYLAVMHRKETAKSLSVFFQEYLAQCFKMIFKQK